MAAMLSFTAVQNRLSNRYKNYPNGDFQGVRTEHGNFLIVRFLKHQGRTTLEFRSATCDNRKELGLNNNVAGFESL